MCRCPIVARWKMPPSQTNQESSKPSKSCAAHYKQSKEAGILMPFQTQAPDHIEITETLVRLYVFLTQYLDRCLDEGARKAYPDEELHLHLSTTREAMADILAVNPVVKSKVEKECKDVLALGAAILKGGHER